MLVCVNEKKTGAWNAAPNKCNSMLCSEELSVVDNMIGQSGSTYQE